MDALLKSLIINKGGYSVNEEDKRIITIIRSIVNKGNNAEIKKKKDGTLNVYEVKKKICTR